jgi:hypothetical protein
MGKKNKMLSKKQLTLIVSDKKPSIQLKPGMRLDVISVALVDPSLKKPQVKGSRLCGGTNTCLALVDVSSLDQP